MSKKVNKTKAIREALEKTPELGPKEIAEQLSKQGVKVTAQYVSMIKSKLKKGSGSKRVATKSSSNGSVSFDDLRNAKAFADQLGGLDRAAEAIQALKSLTT